MKRFIVKYNSKYSAKTLEELEQIYINIAKVLSRLNYNEADLGMEILYSVESEYCDFLSDLDFEDDYEQEKDLLSLRFEAYSKHNNSLSFIIYPKYNPDDENILINCSSKKEINIITDCLREFEQ